MKNNLNLVIVGGAAAGPTAASTAEKKRSQGRDHPLLREGKFYFL